MRVITVEELASLLANHRENPRIIVSGNAAYPKKALEVVDEACETYTVNTLHAMTPISRRPGVTAETSFVGPGMRNHPALRYVPSRLSMVPVLFKNSLPPDIVIAHCAPAVDGQFSLGIEVNVMPAALEACRSRGGTTIAVVNPNMPYTFGDSQIREDYFDYVVEIAEPLPGPKTPLIDDASSQIGTQVASLVPQGATLQLGIGAVPDAALAALKNHHELRVWTEMFSDGLLDLERGGALDTEQHIISSFVMGSEELYSWLNNNRRVIMKRTELTNDPSVIAQQRAMTSINTALQIDLLGQANASRIGQHIYSGFGGQTDFIVGAMHARGGQALMALRSWHVKADCSTIVPILTAPVTSFQQSAVITERGIAHLAGASERDQARALIDQTAHPNVRDDLQHAAKDMGLL